MNPYFKYVTASHFIFLEIFTERNTFLEVMYNEGQNTTKLINWVKAVVSLKQYVLAYSEAIIRFTLLATGDYR